MRWVGWLWSDSVWEKVCVAEDLGQCSHRLGQIARQRGILDRHTGLTGGAAPTWCPSEYRLLGQERGTSVPDTRKG
jgi:hypothetical protein